jgi:signal transduction histidine kinase
MLRRLIREDVELVVTAAAAPLNVRADPGQLEQVLVNLVVNARDAMPGGGRITLETAYVELGEPSIGEQPDVPRGAYVMLAVSDTGTGMDAATFRQIFEPFFTTKPPGEGTGLGLSTVYGIVKQSDGGISVQSERGTGTTFKVYLPRLEATEADPGDVVSVRPVRGTETLLVVEDEKAGPEKVRGVLDASAGL